MQDISITILNIFNTYKKILATTFSLVFSSLSITSVLVAQSCPILWPHGLQPVRLPCPWNTPRKNTGVGSHSLLQGISSQISITNISSIPLSLALFLSFSLNLCLLTFLCSISKYLRASLMAPRVKHLPAMRETRVRFLGREDPLGEGNGNPLQHSCLENPMDRGAW